MDMSLQGKNRGWVAMAAAMLPLLMTGQAHAIKGGEPGTVILDGGMFYPSIGIALTHDDNIFRTDTNKKSSTLLVLTPGARLEYDAGEATQVAFELDMERGVYFDSSDDNYLDVDLFSEAAYLPTERLTFYGRLGYKRGHEARGTGTSAGTPLAISEPDRFHVWSGEGRVSYDIGEQKLEFGYVHEKRLTVSMSGPARGGSAMALASRSSSSATFTKSASTTTTARRPSCRIASPTPCRPGCR
nr:outer membrane beta-barrel protein [endosymbiont of unidentified scaly snail isolate Monju]